MENLGEFRPPVPLFAPAIVVALVLVVLFYFGWREQTKLINDAVEQAVTQREQLAQLVAEGIENDLNQTETSIRRFSHDLERQLELPQADAEAQFEALFEMLPDVVFDRAARDLIRLLRRVFGSRTMCISSAVTANFSSVQKQLQSYMGVGRTSVFLLIHGYCRQQAVSLFFGQKSVNMCIKPPPILIIAIPNG